MAKEKLVEAAARETVLPKKVVRLPPQARPKPKIVGVVPTRRVPKAKEKVAAAQTAFLAGYNYFRGLGDKGGPRYRRFLEDNFAALMEGDFTKSKIKYYRGKEKGEEREIWMMSALMPDPRTKTPRKVVVAFAVSATAAELAASTPKGETIAFVYSKGKTLAYTGKKA